MYYQDQKGRIMNGYFECNWSNGTFVNKGEYPISETAPAVSVHAETGLAVELLGSTDGYRLFYHDENRTIHMLGYTSATKWTEKGVISQEMPDSHVLAVAHSGKDNITVAFPKDDSNIGLSRYNTDKKWHICK
jgi:hypothetical protein